MSGHAQSGSENHILEYAIVVRGPLLPFTRQALTFYLQKVINVWTTGVVFSHHDADCTTRAGQEQLAELQHRFPRNFAAVLSPSPPRLGFGHRNVQRESAFHGIAFAIKLWHTEWVLLHRPDACFQSTHTMVGLKQVMLSMPPMDRRGAGVHTALGGIKYVTASESLTDRVGVCPFQTQLTDYYGRFHVDDHCTFGRAEAVLRYWSVHNPFYNNSGSASTAFTSRGATICPVPGPESESGSLWVQWDALEHRMPPPEDTRALILERLLILDVARWDYVCTRDWKPSQPIQPLALPLNPRLHGFRWPPNAGRMPFGVMNLCRRVRGIYNCTGERASNMSPRAVGLSSWNCKSQGGVPDPPIGSRPYQLSGFPPPCTF